MRRQNELDPSQAGSGRNARLDPLALPIQFTAADPSADRRLRSIELDRNRVVLRRAVSGMRIAINLPISAYRGIALRLVPTPCRTMHEAVVSLEHRDPALSVPLFTAQDCDDAIAEWEMWSRVFGAPLLIADIDGELREPHARMGGVRLAKQTPRRRRKNAIKKRRPSIFLRRRPGNPNGIRAVHRGEREIIARD